MRKIERAVRRAHKERAAVRAVKQRFDLDPIVRKRAAHPAGHHAQRERAVVPQQHLALRAQLTGQRLLVGLHERITRKRLRPDAAHRSERGVNIGRAVLHADELARSAERKLRRRRRRHARRADLIACRAAEQAVIHPAQRIVRAEGRRRNTGEPVRRAQHRHQHREHDERDILGRVSGRTLRASHALPSFSSGARSVGRVMCTVVPLPYSLSSSM